MSAATPTEPALIPPLRHRRRQPSRRRRLTAGEPLPAEFTHPEVAETLRAEGRLVEILDGDVVRTNLSKGLDFSKEDRDTKGLYARALTGELPQFTGVSDPYEPPESPEAIVDTDRESVAQSARTVVAAVHRAQSQTR